MEVKNLMTQSVISLHPNDPMEKAAAIFESREFHHIPIVDNERKVVGMVSRHDYNKILNAFTIFNTENSKKANEVTLRALTTGDVMTRQLATIQMDDTVEKAVAMFRENRFHALPVVNEEKKLEGILTTFDLLTKLFQGEVV